MKENIQWELDLAFVSLQFIAILISSLIAGFVSLYFSAIFKWTYYCHAMAFTKGIRAFYGVIALAASNKLYGIAMNGHNKASCKKYTAILTIETEKKNSIKKQTSNVNPFQTIMIREPRVKIKNSNCCWNNSHGWIDNWKQNWEASDHYEKSSANCSVRFESSHCALSMDFLSSTHKQH